MQQNTIEQAKYADFGASEIAKEYGLSSLVEVETITGFDRYKLNRWRNDHFDQFITAIIGAAQIKANAAMPEAQQYLNELKQDLSQMISLACDIRDRCREMALHIRADKYQAIISDSREVLESSRSFTDHILAHKKLKVITG
jgi:aspartate ammonia-lyase